MQPRIIPRISSVGDVGAGVEVDVGVGVGAGAGVGVGVGVADAALLEIQPMLF
jgi:hypothetical protein